MKVRATNPGPPPAENPGDCASCGFGVPKPPQGGGTSAARRAWAMSQVGRPVVNPGPGGEGPLEPVGHGMARKFKPRKSWEEAQPGTHPGRFGNPRNSVSNQQSMGGGQRRWHSRLARNCDAGVGLALSATQAPSGPIQQANPCFGLHVKGDQVVPVIQQLQANPSPANAMGQMMAAFSLRNQAAQRRKLLAAGGTIRTAAANPPPLAQGRGGQLDYADQYAVFGPGVQPYGGYGGVGYAPGGTSIPTAYPVAPPGVYMQGQSCYSATDCAPGEYCHGGMCFPTPGVQNVGGQRTTSIGGHPVGNPGGCGAGQIPCGTAGPPYYEPICCAKPPPGGSGSTGGGGHGATEELGFLPVDLGSASGARGLRAQVPRTQMRAAQFRRANPGAPMTQITQSLAPPGFSVR